MAPDAFDDARYSTEIIGLLNGGDATLEEFWEARPGSFSLPADGTPFSDPSAYPLDHWMYSVEFASKGWALAQALKEPISDLVPVTSVTNYDFVATQTDTTYYKFGSEVFQYATISPGTDASAPVLNPDSSLFDGAVWPDEEPPMGPQVAMWRGKLDICRQFFPITPWIGHPDKLVSTTVHDVWQYGPRSFFRHLVRICAGEYGITEFIVFMEAQIENGAPDTLTIINEAVNIVRGLRTRVPVPFIRSRLAARSQRPPMMR